MTLQRALKILLVGTSAGFLLFVAALFYVRGSAGMNGRMMLTGLAYAYWLSAFGLTLVLLPLYWFQILTRAWRIRAEIDPAKWSDLPWWLRLSKSNALYLPSKLTNEGKRLHTEFLFALEGMFGTALLMTSLFALMLVAPE